MGDFEVVRDTTIAAPRERMHALIDDFHAFELAPSGDETTGVTWRMRGTTKGFAALFSKVVSMDRMVGKDFEKGLTRMKAAAESGAVAPPRLDG